MTILFIVDKEAATNNNVDRYKGDVGRAHYTEIGKMLMCISFV